MANNKNLKYVDDPFSIPVWERPEVVDNIRALWEQENEGRVPEEGSFVVHGRKTDGTPIMLPTRHDHEYKKEIFRVGPGDTDIFHSHPIAGTDPKPSPADESIADQRPGMGMFVIGKDGLYRYAKGMKSPELVQKGTDFSQYDEELPAPPRPDMSRLQQALPLRANAAAQSFLGSALPPEEPTETAQGVPIIKLAKK